MARYKDELAVLRNAWRPRVAQHEELLAQAKARRDRARLAQQEEDLRRQLARCTEGLAGSGNVSLFGILLRHPLTRRSPTLRDALRAAFGATPPAARAALSERTYDGKSATLHRGVWRGFSAHLASGVPQAGGGGAGEGTARFRTLADHVGGYLATPERLLTRYEGDRAAALARRALREALGGAANAARAELLLRRSAAWVAPERVNEAIEAALDAPESLYGDGATEEWPPRERGAPEFVEGFEGPGADVRVGLRSSSRGKARGRGRSDGARAADGQMLSR